jgi:hypothetical protein
MTGGGGLSFRRGDLRPSGPSSCVPWPLGWRSGPGPPGPTVWWRGLYQEGKLVGELPLDREASSP